jgi:hypothetical protein
MAGFGWPPRHLPMVFTDRGDMVPTIGAAALSSDHYPPSMPRYRGKYRIKALIEVCLERAFNRLTGGCNLRKRHV